MRRNANLYYTFFELLVPTPMKRGNETKTIANDTIPDEIIRGYH